MRVKNFRFEHFVQGRERCYMTEKAGRIWRFFKSKNIKQIKKVSYSELKFNTKKYKWWKDYFTHWFWHYVQSHFSSLAEIIAAITLGLKVSGKVKMKMAIGPWRKLPLMAINTFAAIGAILHLTLTTKKNLPWTLKLRKIIFLRKRSLL